MEVVGKQPVSIATSPHAEFQPAAAQHVEHGGVLGHPDRVLERQRDDRGAKPDPLGLRGHPRQEHQRRRQAAFLHVEVMLGHPSDVVTEALGE